MAAHARWPPTCARGGAAPCQPLQQPVPRWRWLPRRHPAGAGRCPCAGGRGQRIVIAQTGACRAIGRSGDGPVPPDAGTGPSQERLGPGRPPAAAGPARQLAKKLIRCAAVERPCRTWRWEVNLIASKQINAFCMPAAKLPSTRSILNELNSFRRTAMIMNTKWPTPCATTPANSWPKARPRAWACPSARSCWVWATWATWRPAWEHAGLLARFSRDDETEADLVGLELAARAAYNPLSGRDAVAKNVQRIRRQWRAWLSFCPPTPQALTASWRCKPTCPRSWTCTTGRVVQAS